ncbi:glycerate kinase [Lamprobacter sp.]|uniref:glycerate kinase n=1 Tax=Lamprobacter sp. TaxID=3100796 RepID=UPI003A4E55A4
MRTRTTTNGTGKLIRAALDLGAGRILIGIGGSATTDGEAQRPACIRQCSDDPPDDRCGRGVRAATPLS